MVWGCYAALFLLTPQFSLNYLPNYNIIIMDSGQVILPDFLNDQTDE